MYGWVMWLRHVVWTYFDSFISSVLKHICFLEAVWCSVKDKRSTIKQWSTKKVIYFLAKCYRNLAVFYVLTSQKEERNETAHWDIFSVLVCIVFVLVYKIQYVQQDWACSMPLSFCGCCKIFLTSVFSLLLYWCY